MKINYLVPSHGTRQLAAYERIQVGAMNRILTMTEQQAAHRRDLEKLAVTEQLKQSARGQRYGLVVALSGIGASLAAILYGHEVAGGILGASSLLGLVSVFLTGKGKQERSLEEKRPPAS